MADERKFRFVSPGVFTNEIDRSQVPAARDAIGPMIIGQSERGPAFTPTKITSKQEFETIFGVPSPGNAQPGDVWRNGAQNSPDYGAYAAWAYLGAGSTPLTFVRLLGKSNSSATGDTHNTVNKAGWAVPQATTNSTAATTAGAFGLFFFGTSSTTQSVGVLGAVIYASGAAIYPTGTVFGGAAGAGMNTLIDLGTSTEFTLEVSNSSGASKYKASLDDASPNFIRNVFNTNPQLVGNYGRSITSVENPSFNKEFWIGETFERTVYEKITSVYSGYAVAILPLHKQGSAGLANRKASFREAHTPWFVSQDVNTNSSTFSVADRSRAIPLFKFVTIKGQGDYASKKVKVSIDNVRYSPNDNVSFGTFDVLVREASDTDTKPVVLERFSNLTLDPNSDNYIVNKIGDMYEEYDDTNEVLRTYGDVANQSNFVRVVVSPEVAAGDSPKLVPFGYYGVPKFKSVTVNAATTTVTTTYVASGGYAPTAHSYVLSASNAMTASLSFPSIPMRVTSSEAGAANNLAFFGADAGRRATSTVYNQGYVDYTRFLGSNVISDSDWGDNYGLTVGSDLEFQDGFTLDEVVLVTGSAYSITTAPRKNITYGVHTSGSRASGTSFTALTSGGGITAASYKHIIDAGFNRFTAPMFGGFDGLTVFERDSLRNNLIDASATVTTNYVLNSYETALNIIKDKDFYDFNTLVAPGVWKTQITDKMLSICQDRGDALAIIDLQGGYQPPHEIYYAAASSRKGDLQQVLNNIESRNLNNSYGAAYYPWVTVRDEVNGVPLKMPPSVVALGVLGNTEKVADVWFAPAGFNRGGLSNGAAGLPVIAVDEKLNSTDRDLLYARNVNPIASFPSEGIVVFGQKTLQATPSALDRVNVRRLLIYLKKGISGIAATTLFEQNVESTWNDFKGRANNFLGDVKARYGLDDYKVVLDATTTTPDMVDRNILYAKVFVKPARSIEFIALDFIITRSGASFED